MFVIPFKLTPLFPVVFKWFESDVALFFFFSLIASSAVAFSVTLPSTKSTYLTFERKCCSFSDKSKTPKLSVFKVIQNKSLTLLPAVFFFII